ncbi:hypothetical protein COLO4_06956 [Corchorus olitorius]|uniref:Uncharacterized protein n=1 Tax=Corchorus olitorius TaxID=93759 RepID=A0A1R3KLD5_9ROSI|nr:hypothetical protein COLO4_06956 [Corchorus olitorius]
MEKVQQAQLAEVNKAKIGIKYMQNNSCHESGKGLEELFLPVAFKGRVDKVSSNALHSENGQALCSHELDLDRSMFQSFSLEFFM